MKLSKALYIIFMVAIIFISSSAADSWALNLPRWFTFSKENALQEWKEKVFRGRVLYKITSDTKKKKTITVSNQFLMAQSKKSCSGLFYEIKFHPLQRPMVSWKWRIISFPSKYMKDRSDSEYIEKDDFAARFYVIFPKFPFTRTECLEYVWDEALPVGTIKESPYFKNIKLIVIESGRGKSDEWVSEERNIYEDYLSAFGRPPESSVGAIAVMTDSDNTLSTAEAAYDDIKVGYKKDERQ